MRTIVIANEKGGTGKTATAVSLACALQRRGNRVLAIDLDPQMALSDNFNVSCDEAGAYEVLTQGAPLREVIQNSDKQVDVVTASCDLECAEKLLDKTGREHKLKEAIEAGVMHEAYDYLIIDTQRSLGVLTVNGLTAADGVIIPTDADFASINGIAHIHETILGVRKYHNPGLTTYGILLTRFDERTRIAADMRHLAEQLASRINTTVFETAIRRRVVFPEARALGRDIWEHRPGSCVARDYNRFTDELLNRIGREGNG